MPDTKRYYLIAAITSIAIYSIMVRFRYPQLTETELFLKMLGL